MKPLNTYIMEGLADWGDDEDFNEKISKQTTKSAVKKEITAWVKQNCKKDKGRIKIEFNEEYGKFIVSYKEFCEFELLSNDIPGTILFDVECKCIKCPKAKIDNLFEYFIGLRANALCIYQDTSLGTPLNKFVIGEIHCRDISFNNDKDINPELLKFEKLYITTDKLTNVNASIFSNFDDIWVHINASDKTILNLNGLNMSYLDLGKTGGGYNSVNITIKGKYKVKNLHTTWVIVSGDFPTHVDELKFDQHGSFLDYLNHIGVLRITVSPYINEEILKRIERNDLKIDHYINNQGKSISEEHAKNLIRYGIIYNKLHNVDKTDKNWISEHNVPEDTFNKWMKANKKSYNFGKCGNIMIGDFVYWVILDKKHNDILGAWINDDKKCSNMIVGEPHIVSQFT
jgi:hypothetical protein